MAGQHAATWKRTFELSAASGRYGLTQDLLRDAGHAKSQLFLSRAWPGFAEIILYR
ncbi:MAG: hypothetical protein AAGI03_11285 [Pseudomonadota bacterium]